MCSSDLFVERLLWNQEAGRGAAPPATFVDAVCGMGFVEFERRARGRPPENVCGMTFVE